MMRYSGITYCVFSFQANMIEFWDGCSTWLQDKERCSLNLKLNFAIQPTFNFPFPMSQSSCHESVSILAAEDELQKYIYFLLHPLWWAQAKTSWNNTHWKNLMIMDLKQINRKTWSLAHPQPKNHFWFTWSLSSPSWSSPFFAFKQT